MLGGGVVCPNNEFLRFLAYAVWHIPEERQAYLLHLPSEAAQLLNTVQDFKDWLCLQTKGWINLTHLVVWAWDRIAQRQSTPQMPPIQPTSQHVVRSTQSALAKTHIIQWCVKHQLSQDHLDILVKLGFSPGDDLKMLLTDEDWHAARVLPLQKRRLIEASEKDKEEHSRATKC